jgi:hypothetical protein
MQDILPKLTEKQIREGGCGRRTRGEMETGKKERKYGEK